MLNKAIHTHLDKLEGLEDTAGKDIEKAVKAIDIDSVIDNPESVLAEITEAIKQSITSRYGLQALKEGVDFAKNLKTIKIQKTDNPELNK